MDKTINIKFDKEQLEDIVKKVTENIMKEVKPNFYELADIEPMKPKKKWSLMYLEANVSHYESEKKKVYFGHLFNTLSKGCASDFDFSKFGREQVNELKSQGWKEEVVYK